MASFNESEQEWGGLNMDDSDFAINSAPNGQKQTRQDYRNARNFRSAVNQANRGRALTNVLSNLKINTYILPYSGGAFPAGQNRCIGATEETRGNTIIFFVWNSNGKHQILRYYRDLADPLNPNGIVQQVILFNGTGIGTGGLAQGFGWTKNTRITSINIIYSQVGENDGSFNPAIPGDLCYFSDPTPHVIDLTRANICGKLKSYIFYAPYSYNSFGLATTFNFSLFNYVGTRVFAINIPVPASTENNGIYTFNGQLYNSLSESNTAALSYIATQINTGTNLIVAEGCGCALTITESDPTLAATSFLFTHTGPVLKGYPLNWYGPILADRVFDRSQYPPTTPPIAEYRTNNEYLPNNVQNNVWQFRTLYTYATASPSAPGMWSLIPTDNLQCDGTNNPLLNYIDVNFNDPYLIDSTTLLLFNQIWFIARTRNSVIQPDQVVKQLYPCDVLDYDGVNWYCHYQFYNNIQATPLDPVISAQLFDDVPTESAAELENANLIIEGGVKNGLAAPDCTDANFKVQIDPASSGEFFDVTVYYRVLSYGMAKTEADIPDTQDFGPNWGPLFGFYSLFPTYSMYPFWKPNTNLETLQLQRGGIFQNSLNVAPTPLFPFYGGGGYQMPRNSQKFGITNGMETTYNQLMGSSGFTAYSTGKPIFAISKQINVSLPQIGTTGILDSSTSQNLLNIGNYLNPHGTTTPNDIYSVALLRLPKGINVIRTAHNWCSVGGLLGNQKNYAAGPGTVYDLSAGMGYQRTSACVHGVYLSPNVQPMNDAVNSWTEAKEITVDVQSDMVAGTFVIMDLAPPSDVKVGGKDGISWNGVNAYVLDSSANGNLQTNLNSPSFDGVSVEKAIVTLNANPDTPPASGTSNITWQGFLTDHNGFWFGICALTNTGKFDGPGDEIYKDANIEFTVLAWQVGNGNNTAIIQQNPSYIFGGETYMGSLANYYNQTLVPLNFFNSDSGGTTWGNGLLFFCSATNNVNSRQLCSTIITGSIIDQNGQGISNALAIYQQGKYGFTSLSGVYNVIAWGDLIAPNTNNFPFYADHANTTGIPINVSNDRGIDNLVLSLGPLCTGTYPQTQEISILIADFGNSPYGYPPLGRFYTVPPFTVIEQMASANKCLKRGATYIPGLRGGDYQGRLSTVVGLDDKLYIPSTTEDLNLYPYCVQPNGLPWPAGSYIQGKPTILWNFNNTMKPATRWAFYDLVLTPDLFYGNYIQWVVNSVQYISSYANPIAGTTPINTNFTNNDAVAVLLDISNMNAYNANNPGASIGYTYTKGDRVRFVLDGTGAPLQSPVSGPLLDFAVTGVYTPPATGSPPINSPHPNQLVVALPLSLPFQILAGYTIEIYTPAAQNTTETQLLYEMAQHFICTNPGSLNNAYGTTSGSLTCGDTYWRNRIILVSDENTGVTGVYTILMEAQDVSDLYPSIASDTGRPGQIDPAVVPLNQRTKMVCSGTYLADSAINGLSTFNPNAPVQATIDQRYGSIQRLFYENNLLQIICTGKNITAPINRNLMYQGASDQSIISLSGEFFNPLNFRIEAKNLGTDFPASCCSNSGIIFGYNNFRANTFKWFGEQELVTSDRKMIAFFKQLEQDGVLDAVAAYDRYYEEYILTYWRRYAINAIPSINFTTAGAIFSFVMPGPAQLVSAIYGNLGQPPQIGSQVSMQVVYSGIQYAITGTVTHVDTGNTQYSITGTIDTGSSDGYLLKLQSLILANPTTYAQFIFGLPETLLWNEGTEEMKARGEAQVWRGFLDNTPELWQGLGTDMCSFKDGKIYLTTAQGATPATQRNTFYGTRYNSLIAPVFNGIAQQHNAINKVWNSIIAWLTQGQQVGGGNKGSNNFFSNPAQGSGLGISNTYGQQSRLNASNWRFDENHWAIGFQRDLNDISIPLDPPPSVNPAGKRLLNGMVLRSEALTVELINDYPGEIVLYALKANYTPSAGPIR